MPRDVFNVLEFFSGLKPTQLDLLRSLFAPCDSCSGATLFEQGESAEYLYIVVVGEVVVNFKPDDGPSLVVARVQPGGVVGWSAAFGRKVYTSSAMASTDTRLLRVRGADLRSLCEQYPDTGTIILDRLAAVIAERLRNTQPQVKAMLEAALHNGVYYAGG
jgi:CRP-like cAMP-binding protein